MAHALYDLHVDAAFVDEDTSIDGYDDDSMLIAPRGNEDGKFAGRGGGGDAGVGDGGGGLGSLADELAGAMYDSGEEYDDDDEDAGEGNEYEEGGNGRQDGGREDDGGGAEGLSGGGGSGGVGRGWRGGATSDYDGSEYGDLEDLTAGISVALEEKIGQIEKLAARNEATTTGEEDGEIVPKLMEGLQKLPPQSGLESGCTRLITAHSALATHMIYQARTLRNLSLGVNLSDAPLDDDTLDLLLPLIDLMPRPASGALTELASLHALTLSLTSQLSFLSDTLHMVRQSSIAANRKLRVAKEACADWKSELERVERSRRWIEDGDWDAKCRNRNAASVCSQVTDEFEDVCRGFEESLRAQAVVA
ncbi:unnamed protein product [Tuber aestivum]|uniref:Uncharacterized protein n=1 Tax=Tuber aestivum TaxID=59557 RepID=A0A292PLK5_9PEZI|nr:unnamed protein product [Tuber aestivum]